MPGVTFGLLLLVSCAPLPLPAEGRAASLTPPAIADHDRPTARPPAKPATATPLIVTPVPRPSFGPPPTPTRPGAGFPGEPAEAQGFVIDRSSAAFAEERRTIADDYASLRFERPFTRTAMDYVPFVDILRAEISAQNQWVYVSIVIQDLPPSGAEVMYAVELDADRDGRGDWLIVASAPLASAWTHESVQVLQDGDEDVGGATPLVSDIHLRQGSGYETVDFDDGDPASRNPAWARIAEGSDSRIQFALNHDWLGDEARLLWGVWADAGLQDPRLYDYNDTFTLREAGSPLSTSPDYPLRLLTSVDNTCRWAFGFAPRGTEPGLCGFEPPTPFPSATPIPATPTP
ncbi:MAG: hypothetical protein ACRDG5_05730 [Anaerolineales bacterium]